MDQKPPAIASHRPDEQVEISRRELLAFLRSDRPAWQDQDHSELASGSAAWVRNLRRESERRQP